LGIAVVKGYVWRHVKQEGAKVFIRGIRSWEKDGHDERSLQILNTWGPLVLGPLWWPIPTMFLEGNPEYNHVSSTLIRNICRTKDEKEALEDVSRLVPRVIAEDVTRFYGADKWKADEDKTLTDAVLAHGGKNWKEIAAQLPGRSETKCRSRWHNTLDVDSKSARVGKWTPDEKLKDAVLAHG
jgi:hypothetical protein